MAIKWKQRRAKIALSGSNRLRFYEVLKLQLDSGRSLEEAMRNIHDVYTQGGKRYHAYGIFAHDCLESLSINKEGNLLPDIFRRWFSAEEAASMAAGMRTNSLSAALERLIILIKALQSIRATVAGAALAPFAGLLAVSGLLASLSVQLIPLFAKIIPREKASGGLSLTYSMADFVTIQGPYVLTALITLYVVANWSQPHWTGRLRRLVEYMPPYYFYRLMQGSVFLLNLSTLTSSGMSFHEALSTLHKNGDSWLRERLAPTIHHFSNGHNLGTSLELSGYNFPSRELILHLKAFSQGEGAELAIGKLAYWWLQRTRNIARSLLYLSMLVSIVMVFGCLSILGSSMLSMRNIVNM